MSYVRKETISKFSEEDLLKIVKKNLDALDIHYEEKPGGFGVNMWIDPSVFDLTETDIESADLYLPQKTASRTYYKKRALTYAKNNIWTEALDIILVA